MQAEEVLQLIKGRRSVRHFTGRPVDDEAIHTIMEAGRWAPSGLNNQPWRFHVVRDPAKKEAVAGLTHYSRVVAEADVLIAVFIHKPSMYNPTKDHQAMGACLQNMLLMAHGLGLGAVWLGEILKNADQVRRVLGLDEDLELMAVVALGWPDERQRSGQRKGLGEMTVSPGQGA